MPQPSPVTVSLRGLSVVSADVAWASGENGTVLRTRDGGATWAACTVPGARDRDLRDVEGLDEKTALVMAIGSPAHIWRTADGGASWSMVHEDLAEGVFFDSMSFADQDRGYAFSDPVDGSFVAIATDDAGRTWRAIDGLPTPLDGEAGFAASGTCVAAHRRSVWIGTGGGGPRVLRSTDSGASWDAAPVPMIADGPSSGIFSVAFRDLRNGVAVGGDYAHPALVAGNAAFTADGGRSWHAAPVPPPSGFRSCVAFLPGAPSPTCFAVGPTGIDSSRDGGLSWTRVAAEGFHTVAFARTEPAGWAVGDGGRIARYDAREPGR